jgi:hypothetical protein
MITEKCATEGLHMQQVYAVATTISNEKNILSYAISQH